MDLSLPRFRLYLLTAIVLVGFGVLLNRLYEFQIERRNEFLNQVPGNRTVNVREPGIRGEITDRNGVALVRNRASYEVSFNLDEIVAAYKAQYAETPKDIVEIVNEFTIKRLVTLGLATNYRASLLRTHYITHGGLVPFSYRADLTFEEFSKFAEHNLDLPGVYLSTRPIREYPFGTLGSHILGYVKPWEKGDIPESAARQFNHYIGDEKGVAGVEATMNEYLRGPEGHRTILKNEKGHTIGTPDIIYPGIGARVELAIDARVQLLLENVLRRIGRGAGVIMNVNTGEVLALASVPDYAPSHFVPSISAEQYAAYEQSRILTPLTNRALAQYAPGSTFKLPTAVAGARQGLGDRRFTCEGYVPFGNHRIGCWIYNQSRGSHGSLSLEEALQRSCNPYFNKLANTIGWRNMVEGFQLLNLGSTTGIELPGESAGLVIGSRTWRAAFPNERMTPAQTAYLSIGQSQSMATPLQLCAMAACIANGGKYYQPRIVKQAIAEDGSVVLEDKPRLKLDLTQEGVPAADIERIRRGMWLAVNKQGGTAGRVRMPTIEVAAKTGTAQTTDVGKESHNSWVVSFAPFENPKYAVCILSQHSGSGGAVCGPLVHLVYRGLFARDEGMKLPLKPQTKYDGHLNRIESIELPEDVFAAINATEDLGETGDEVGDVAVPDATQDNQTLHAQPAFTPEVDDEGVVVPRAVPVEE